MVPKSKLSKAIHDFPIISWLQSHAVRHEVGKKYVRADCPACGGKFTLSINKVTKYGHCFRCYDGNVSRGIWNGRGSLPEVVQLFEKTDYKTAIAEITSAVGMPEVSEVEAVVQKPANLLPSSIFPVTAANKEHPCRQLLDRRGLSHLEAYIYLCVDGQYANRWILPAWQFGQLEGFEAKSFLGAKPKSLFPTWMQTGKLLYTTYSWEQTDWCVITESIFDAETLGKNAIGLYGSAVRDGQLLKLLEMRKRGINSLVWFLDHDAMKKMRNIILSKTLSHFDNYVVEYPESSAKDPNELGRDECWKMVQAARPANSALDVLALTSQ